MSRNPSSFSSAPFDARDEGRIPRRGSERVASAACSAAGDQCPWSDVINFPDPTRHSLSRDDPSAFAAPAQFGPFRVLHQIGVGALGPSSAPTSPSAIGWCRQSVPSRHHPGTGADPRGRDLARGRGGPLSSLHRRADRGGVGHARLQRGRICGSRVARRRDAALRAGANHDGLPFITQLAGAIDFARAAGVRHGALHPRDIFVTPEEARATGFGVVEALERIGIERRSDGLTAPERIADGSWATAADIFSLAAITYELLTARRPAGLGREIGTLTAGTQRLDGFAAFGPRTGDGFRAV